MDLTADQLTLDDPQLPSSAFQGKLLGELFGGEISQPANMPVWGLDQTGHTYDAARVHGDGRMKGGLHSPGYYVYSPQRSSWEDGLQAIEDFDWPESREPEQSGRAWEDGSHDSEGRRAMEYFDQSRTHGTEDSPPSLQPLSPRANTKPDGHDQSDNSPLHSTQQASTLIFEPAETWCMPPASPPWIPDVPNKKSQEPPTTATQGPPQPHLANSEAEIEHGDATDSMHIEPAPAPATDTLVEQTEASESIPLPSPQNNEDANDEVETSQIEGHVAPKAALDDNEEVTTDTGASHEVENVGMSLLHPVLLQTIPEPYDLMPRQALLPIAMPQDILTQDLPDLDPGDAAILMPHALYRTQSSATDPFLSSEQNVPILTGPSMSPALENTKDVDAFENNADIAVPKAALVEEESTVLPPTEEAPTSEVLDQKWQEQLQEAAAETSPDSLPDILPSIYTRRGSVPHQISPTNPAEEAPVQKMSAQPSTMSEQQVSTISDLPPSPFESVAYPPNSEEASFGEGEVTSAIVSKDGEIAGEQVNGLSQSSYIDPSVSTGITAEMEVHTQHDDQTTAKTAEVPSIPSREVPSLALSENDASAASGTPQLALRSEVRTINSRKRSKPTKDTQNSSDTEDSAPAKKKLRKSKRAKPRGPRGAEASAVPLDDAVEASATKSKRRAAKSVRETSVDNDAEAEEETQQGPGEHTSPLARFALRSYAKPPQEPAAMTLQGSDGGLIFGSEAEVQQPDNDNDVDMEEHYSDVDVPASPAAQASLAPTLPSTPRARPAVSKRELSSLRDNTPRDRSASKRKKEETAVIPGPHLALHLNPASQKRTAKASTTPEAVTNAGNAFLLVENDTPDAAAADETYTPSKAPTEPEKHVSAVNTRKISGPKPKAKPAPVKKAKKEKKQNHEADTQSDLEEQTLIPAPLIEPNQPEIAVPTLVPPKIKPSLTKKPMHASTSSNHDDAARPWREARHEFDLGYDKRHTRSDTRTEKQSASITDDADDETEDYSDAPVAKVKPAAKRTLTANASPLLLSVQTKSIATAGANRYGFNSSRRQRAVATPRSAPAPALATSQSGKSDADADAGTTDTDGGQATGPEKRQTRRASALANDVLAAQAAQQKGRKKGASGGAQEREREKTASKEPEARKTRRRSALEEEIRRKEEIEKAGSLKLRLRKHGGGEGE